MKVAIIGGGHNSLIAAWRLAEAGHDVELFERLAEFGGAVSTRRFDCGCYVNDGANAFGMLDSEVVNNLHRADLMPNVHFASPSLILPLSDGRVLPLFGDDVELTARHIADSTGEPTSNTHEFFEFFGAAIDAVRPLWRVPAATHADFRVALRTVSDDAPEIFLSGSLDGLLGRFVKSTEVRSLLAAGNMILPMPATAPGTAFPSLYLGLSEVEGRPGWGVVEGGMGNIGRALALLAESSGATLRKSAPVRQILSHAGRVGGIELEDGSRVHADVVVSGVDPVTTIVTLASKSFVPNALLVDRLMGKHHDGACIKFNVLLNSPLEVKVRTTDASCAQIVICPSMEYLDDAYLDYQRGHHSRAPYVEATMAYKLDPTASCGDHFPVSFYAVFCPYADAVNTSDRREIEEAIVRAVEEFCTPFSKSIEWSELLLPCDIEARYGMYRGNVDHGPMAPGNRLEDRPFRLAEPCATPLRGLYLCGSGVHPGGLVSGRSGLNCAAVLLSERSDNAI